MTEVDYLFRNVGGVRHAFEYDHGAIRLAVRFVVLRDCQSGQIRSRLLTVVRRFLQETQPFIAVDVKIADPDRKSTRLNSSHVSISYAVFCLKKKIIHTVLFSNFLP